MVKIQINQDKSYEMDGYLYNNLSYAKKIIKDDWDFIFCVDGGERKGKSVFAQQLAYFCDETFNLDRIVFTPKQFKDAILNAQPYQAVVYDEAYGGINSRATMSKVNRSIVKMLTEIGSRNLFVFIVLPCFFELDRYISLWRAKILFHIYTNDVKGNITRGYFTAYNEEKKKDLYILGKKFLNYNVVEADFHGKFGKTWIVDKEAYENKKRASQLDDTDETLVFDNDFKEKLILFICKNEKLKNNEEKAKALNVSVVHFYRLIKERKELLEQSIEGFKFEDDIDKLLDEVEIDESENIK